MEAFLHYVWEHRRWESLTPAGILSGCNVEVLDIGLCNKNAGPDFLEAKVRIDDIVWVGAVEIHERASQWYEHGHHLDSAYNGTILHVVEHWDKEIRLCNGRLVPCLIMRVPEELRAQASLLVTHAQELPCTPFYAQLREEPVCEYLQRLARERLEAKSRRLMHLAEQYDWHEALHISLFRYHGFGLNNEAMETLARALPYKLLARYLDNEKQCKALIFGQASLIDKYPNEEEREQISAEYDFLRHKHSLEPISSSLWRRLRTRPASFPECRLHQLTDLLRSGRWSLSAVLSVRTAQELHTLLTPLSPNSADSIGINVLLPFAYAHGAVHEGKEIEPHLSMLATLPAENNKITRLFSKAGIKIKNALESQAVLQLYRNYCEAHKCLYCHWGRLLLSRPFEGDN